MNTNEQLLVQLFPNALKIDWETKGYSNDIAVVDDKLSVRFPKTSDDRKNLGFESVLLGYLKGKISLQIPELVEIGNDNAYSINKYIKGSVYADNDLRNAISGNELEYAKPIALFIEQLNQAITPDLMRKLRMQTGAKGNSSYENAYRGIDQLARKNDSKVSRLYLSYRKQLANAFPEGLDSGEVVVHDDLHSGNLIYDQSKLIGVIDFGDATTGTIYRELRPLFRYGEEFMRALISLLIDKFGPIDYELVRLFAIMHELGVLVEQPANQRHPKSRIEFTNMILEEWLGINYV